MWLRSRLAHIRLRPVPVGLRTIAICLRRLAIVLCGSFCARLTSALTGAIVVPTISAQRLAGAILGLQRLTSLIKLTLYVIDKANIMLCVLLEVLHRNPVARKRAVMSERLILFDDLRRCTPHTSLGTGGLVNAVQRISNVVIVVASTPIIVLVA